MTQTGITPAIISLAVLKVNWDTKRKDYVDNFVPIIAECIRLSEHEVVSLPNLQQDIRSKFGLRVPQHQLRAVLTRVSKHGFIRAENRAFVRVPERLAELNFGEVHQQVIGRHEQILNSLVNFARDRHGVEWSTDDAERAMYSYLATYQLLDTTTVVSGPSSDDDITIKGGQYVVGAFVGDLRDRKDQQFDYFETIAKGDILATAIFLPDPNRSAQKFRKTSIYFDTSVLIYALGHAGEARQAPCAELLQLLYQAGAELRCFSHTLDEVRSSLIACAIRMESNRLADAYGPSIEYFIEKGLTPSEVRLRAARLEKDLETVRVRVVEKPAFDKEYMVDEQALANAIQKDFTFSNQNALWRDVSSISSVIRLRANHQSQMVEECRAAFVTTNIVLCRAAKEFMEKEHQSDVVPPALTDHALTNLLWLKLPMQAPDLPRKRIIAACFAATQPDDGLWQRYLAEIQKLKATETVTPDDYFLLRHSLQARAALMDLTLGDEKAFAGGTVQEILDLVRADIQRELHGEIVEERQRRVDAEASAAETVAQVKATFSAERTAVQAALDKAKAREEARRGEVRLRSVRWAKVIGRTLACGALILLAIGSASTFPWWNPVDPKSRIRFAVAGIQAVLFVFGLVNWTFGTSVKTLLRSVEVGLATRLEQRLLSLSGDAGLFDFKESEGPSQL